MAVSGNSSARLNIGLVGGGKGGSALLDLLLDWPEASITVVVDGRPDAPGLAKARALGIPTTAGHLDVFAYPVDLVLEATGQRAVLEELLRVKPPHVEVIGAGSLRFFWDLLQDRVKVTRQAEALGQKLTALSTLTGLFRSAADSREVFKAIVAAATTLLGAKIARVWVNDPAGQVLRAQATAGADPNVEHMVSQFSTIPYGHGVVWGVLNSRAPEYLRDIQQDSRLLNRPFIEDTGGHAFAGLPLLIGADVVGVLALLFGERRQFTREEKKLMRLLADQAAIAIHNARLFDETARGRRAAESLTDVGRLISQSLNVGEVAQLVADSVRALLSVQSSALYRLESESGDLVALASSGDVGPTFGRNLVFPSGTGVAGIAVRERQAVITPNLLSDPRVVLSPEVRARIEATSYRAVLAVPLIVRDRIIGALGIGDRAGRRFEQEEIRLAQVFADQAAIALENARLFEQVVRERQRLDSLYGVTRRLAAVHEPDQILNVIVLEAARLLGADAAALRLVEGDDIVLRAQTESAVPIQFRHRLRVGESLSGRAVATGQPVVVADLAEDTRYDPVHKRNALVLGFHGFLAVPLQTAETKIGALMVYTRTIRRFTPDDISLLTALADHASLAIDKDRLLSERARVNETLRQSEKLASLAHLLAGVAHELNNPLAVIVGYSQLLQRTVASPSTAQQLQRIVEATDRCVNIVRNFLALARQEPPARQWVDLTKIVREAADLFVYPFRTDGVKMTLDLDEDVPPIWADPHQLKQVLVNLLSNAHHAVAQTQGQRGVTVRSHVDRPRGRVCLAVSDTGPGIPPEIRSRVFDPFFTTKPVGQGTGLGLSLCHAIVDAHEGSIRVGETSGTGTTMLVEIPIGAAPGDRSEAAAVDPSSIPERKTILVVDDEPALVALLTDTLTRDGHRVETASNGALALERLSAAPYDVILCDVKMPVLDGQELHRRLQRSRPELVSRLVFITGDSLSPDTSAFLERTRLPVLMKPFHVDDVRRVVHRVGQAP